MPAKKPTAAPVEARSETLARGRAPEYFEAEHQATADAVEKAIRDALPKWRKQHGEETLYAFAVYTSGTGLFAYAKLSANTEQGLEQVAKKYLRSKPRSDLAQQRVELRWNAPDWAHHAFASVRVASLGQLLAIRSRHEDAAIWNAFATALERCDADGLFGAGEEREKVTLAILCGDMDARFFMKGVRRLNSKRVAARAQREFKAQYAR